MIDPKWILIGIGAIAFLAPTRTSQALQTVGTGGRELGSAITALGSVEISPRVEPVFAPRFSPDVSPRVVPEIGIKTDFPDIFGDIEIPLPSFLRPPGPGGTAR